MLIPSRVSVDGLGDGCEQESVGLVANRAISHNLPGVVNVICFLQRPAGEQIDQGVQIDHHRAAVEEGMLSVAGGVGPAHDLPVVVDIIGPTDRSDECTQVGHCRATVEEGMPEAVAGGVSPSSPLSLLVAR